jgi:hypothetical protein
MRRRQFIAGLGGGQFVVIVLWIGLADWLGVT